MRVVVCVVLMLMLLLPSVFALLVGHGRTHKMVSCLSSSSSYSQFHVVSCNWFQLILLTMAGLVELSGLPDIGFDTLFGAVCENVLFEPSASAAVVNASLFGPPRASNDFDMNDAFKAVPVTSRRKSAVGGQGRWQRSYGALKAWSRRPRNRKLVKFPDAADKIGQAWIQIVAIRKGETLDWHAPRYRGGRTRHLCKHMRSPSEAQTHPQKYLSASIIRIACDNVGGGHTRRSRNKKGKVSHAPDSKGLFCLTCTSEICHQAMHNVVDSVIHDINSHQIGVVLFESHCDATPVMASFGQLAATVAEYARYLHLDSDSGLWKLLNLEEWKGTSFGRRCPNGPRKGVIELFAQGCYLDCLKYDGHSTYSKWLSHNLLVQPRMFPNSKASAVFSATDAGVPQFRLQRILGL